MSARHLCFFLCFFAAALVVAGHVQRFPLTEASAQLGRGTTVEVSQKVQIIQNVEQFCSKSMDLGMEPPKFGGLCAKIEK